MNKHLSPEEFVDAIDGTLPAPRRAHMDQCESCRQEAGVLAGLAKDVDAAADVPEPSPLFWDHLSRRVREATAGDEVSAPGWWRWAWRPVLAAGAMVVAATFVVLLRGPVGPVNDSPTRRASVDVVAPVASAEVGERDAAWDLVVALAGELSVDAVHDVLPSGPETAILPETMTAREREEFVKLLKQEMGGLE